MRHAQKKAIPVSAWELGQNTKMENELIQKGLLHKVSNDTYEIFSKEANDGKGEIAHSGDYIKISDDGQPYPNTREWFIENHRHIAGDQWEQIQRVRPVWHIEDAMCDEIQWLLDTHRLTINMNGFSTVLWGTRLSSPLTSAIVFYSITKENGTITDIAFNFVAMEDFELTYEYVD